jgi:hypothetical protein
METGGLLSSLALNTWYKVVMYLGLILFAVGLSAELRGLTNGEALLLGTGLFLIGLGEWKNHKTVAWIKPPNVYTGPAALVQTKARQPDAFGIILEGAGIVFLALGGWHIVARTWLAANA